MSSSNKTSDHRISLRLTPHTIIHARVQCLDNCVVVFLTSNTHETTRSLSSLGSFVYALPNRLNSSTATTALVPLSTALVAATGTLDFATRAAQILARRLNKPVYVGNSISLGFGLDMGVVSAGGGGSDGSGAGAGTGPEVSEEIEALRKVVEVVTKAVAEAENETENGNDRRGEEGTSHSSSLVNGITGGHE